MSGCEAIVGALRRGQQREAFKQLGRGDISGNVGACRYFVDKCEDLVTRWNTIVVNAVQVLGNLQVFIVFMTINDLLKVDGEVTIRVEIGIKETARVLEGIQVIETDHRNEIRGDRVGIRRHLEIRVFGIQ